MSKSDPELLKLLNSRSAWNLPPYSKPKIDAPYQMRLDEAVTLHARANPSDPFAASRMNLYLRQGYELASDIADDARNRMKANG